MSDQEYRTERTRLAVAGARATTRSIVGDGPRADRVSSFVFPAVLLLGLATALTALVAIIGYSLYRGWPALRWSLLTNVPSTVNPDNAGFGPAIWGTVYVIGGVIAIIVPLGVASALYLEEYADHTRWWNRMIEVNIQNLAGVPSIVFGILGLAYIVRGPLSLGFVAAAGSITVALLVLPTVILASREALRSVPPSIREGSMALGATKWQTMRGQVLPAAVPGILTGVILAVARAIGEAAPLLLVGAVTFVTFNPNFFEGGYSTLPTMIYSYAGRPQDAFRTLAFAGVIVMLIVLFAINSVAVWLRNRYERTW